jgi:hypothetical protein
MKTVHVVRSLAAILLAAAGFVRAQDLPQAGAVPEPGLPKYRVEFILFAHTNIDPSEEEFSSAYQAPAVPTPSRVFRERPLTPPTGDNLEAIGNESGPGPVADPSEDPFEFIDPFGQLADTNTDPGLRPGFRFRLLRSDEFMLNDAFARIDRLGAYRALAHGGWVQEGLDENAARPMNLANLGVVNPTGTLQLSLSRFLHLGIDLEYQADPTPAAIGSGVSGLEELRLRPHYKIVGQRRARSGELHYIDHPLFGLLFMISPAPEENDGTEDAVTESAPAA